MVDILQINGRNWDDVDTDGLIRAAQRLLDALDAMEERAFTDEARAADRELRSMLRSLA